MTSPAEACLARRNGEIAFHEWQRLLVMWPDYYVPARLRLERLAVGHAAAAGEYIIFASEEFAREQGQSIGTGENPVIHLSGLDLFASVVSGDRLELHSESGVFVLNDEVLTGMPELTGAVRLEQDLKGLATSDPSQGLLDRIAESTVRTVLYEGQGGFYHMALAPDEGGRNLAALFTAADALQVFQWHLEQDHTPDELQTMNPQILSATLREVCQRLSGDEGLDGVVFNCLGPTLPIGFNKSFLAMFA